MKKMKRAVIAFVAAFALIGGGLSLVACSGGAATPEDAITADINAQMEPIANLDATAMEELVASVEDAGLAEYGIDATDYIETMLDGFDYSIDGVTVDENEEYATAEVTITCKTFTEATEIAEELTYEYLENNDVASMTEDDLNAVIGEILMEATRQCTPVSTTCVFDYTNVDGTWTMDDTAEGEIYNAFFA